MKNIFNLSISNIWHRAKLEGEMFRNNRLLESEKKQPNKNTKKNFLSPNSSGTEKQKKNSLNIFGELFFCLKIPNGSKCVFKCLPF